MIVRDIERAFNDSVEIKGVPGYIEGEIPKSGLSHLFRRLDEKRKEAYRVLELGGGQSTLFMQSLLKLELISLEVCTVNHHKEDVEFLQKRLSEHSEKMKVHLLPLRQVTDEESDSLFAEADLAMERWPDLGQAVEAHDHRNYGIKNTFYGNLDELKLEKDSIDVLIIDGPNGNGRGLSYPLFAPFLREGALILIDDFDHYPFVEDLKKVFHVEEQYREILGENRWILMEVIYRKFEDQGKIKSDGR